MEYKIKKLYFGDIRKVAQTFTELELTTKDVKALYDLFGALQNQASFPSAEVADAYLRENLTKVKYTKECKDLNEQQLLEKASALRLEKTNFVDVAIEQGIFLVKLLATKFDVIVDFMDYFITNVTTEQILAFEGEDTKKALITIFTNAGFLQYFKSMFN